MYRMLMAKTHSSTRNYENCCVVVIRCVMVCGFIQKARVMRGKQRCHHWLIIAVSGSRYVLVVDLFVNGKYCVSRADDCQLQVEGRLHQRKIRYEKSDDTEKRRKSEAILNIG